MKHCFLPDSNLPCSYTAVLTVAVAATFPLYFSDRAKISVHDGLRNKVEKSPQQHSIALSPVEK